MVKVNENMLLLPESYLFSKVAHKISDFKNTHPGIEIIRMDIGDVTQPLFPVVVEAIKEGADELANSSTFHGYGPEQGYSFLRDAISKHDYKDRGINIDASDIFVSDGAKSDLGNLGDIFAQDCKVAIMNPSYPVYVDDNVMDGRIGEFKDGKWCGLIMLNSTSSNNFMPSLPSQIPDIIYLCFPNNPTGVAISKNELQKWVEYAREIGSLIIYDSAYEAYVREDGIVRSIYEIEGAKEVAIEVRSFSKTAGFTGLRCGYTVVPHELKGIDLRGNKISINKLWNRRQTTKFNGASYISQKAAAALYTEEGRNAIKISTDYYLSNAKLIRSTLEEIGFKAFGGVNSPYVWASCEADKDSWQLFNRCLTNFHFSTTPGSGFGTEGQGYIRLTGFNSREKTVKAMEIIKKGF